MLTISRTIWNPNIVFNSVCFSVRQIVRQMVQQSIVWSTKNNGNFITEIFILIIASIYLLKIVVAKLQKN